MPSLRSAAVLLVLAGLGSTFGHPAPAQTAATAGAGCLALDPRFTAGLDFGAAERQALAQACARIPTIRQRAATIAIVDSRGQAVRDSVLRIEQTNHGFAFGGHPNEIASGAVRAAESPLYEVRFFGLFYHVVWGFIWRIFEPVRGSPRYDFAERSLQWAERFGATVRATPLLYTQWNPPWFVEIADPNERARLAEARVRDMMTRYRGRVRAWDVVNETKNTVSLVGMMRGQQMIAPTFPEGAVRGIADYVDPAFRWARQSDPDAVLLINDNRIVSGRQRDKVEAILRELKRRGTPFDAIGIQTHMREEGRVPLDRVQEGLDRLAGYGRLRLTEVSVPSRPQRPEENVFDGAPWPGWTEETQAGYVVALYTLAFGHPAVDEITYWSMTERRSDPPTATTGLLREDLSPRPAYLALHELLRGTWWTRWSGRTDNAGRVRLQAFYGDYDLVANLPDGREVRVPFTIDGKDATIVLVLQ